MRQFETSVIVLRIDPLASADSEMSSAEFAEAVCKLLPESIAAAVVLPEERAIGSLKSHSELGGMYAKRRNADGTVSRFSVLALLAQGNDGGKVSSDRIERQRRHAAST